MAMTPLTGLEAALSSAPLPTDASELGLEDVRASLGARVEMISGPAPLPGLEAALSSAPLSTDVSKRGLEDGRASLGAVGVGGSVGMGGPDSPGPHRPPCLAQRRVESGPTRPNLGVAANLDLVAIR